MARKTDLIDKMGQRYLLARAEGKSSHESCEIVRSEFEKPGLSNSTIRSYGNKVRQMKPEYRRREKRVRLIPLEPTRMTFRLIPQLAMEFEHEAIERKMTSHELMNMILFQRYTKEIKD
jgi:hypothetical protein